MHCAFESGSLDTIALLVKRGIDLNIRSKDGTVIEKAAATKGKFAEEVLKITQNPTMALNYSTYSPFFGDNQSDSSLPFSFSGSTKFMEAQREEEFMKLSAQLNVHNEVDDFDTDWFLGPISRADTEKLLLTAFNSPAK